MNKRGILNIVILLLVLVIIILFIFKIYYKQKLPPVIQGLIQKCKYEFTERINFGCTLAGENLKKCLDFVCVRKGMNFTESLGGIVVSLTNNFDGIVRYECVKKTPTCYTK